MDDLISRQAAIDLEPPERYERQYQTMNLDDAYESGWYDAQAGISQLSPANVRPVVTCAECDWHVDCGYHFCNKWCQPCPDNADFYCAYGERSTAVPT